MLTSTRVIFISFIYLFCMQILNKGFVLEAVNTEQESESPEYFDSAESNDAPMGRSFGSLSNYVNFPGPSHDSPPIPCKCRCGDVNHEARVVGGKESDANIYPWMARLSYFGRFFCGGSLINDRYVVTAAHCLQGYMWFLIKVTFGEHDRCIGDSVETRYVLRVIYKSFNIMSYDDDIALLRLNDRVPINYQIRPICLPNRKASKYAGKKAIVAGWGAVQERGAASCVLREAKVSIMTNLDCTQNTYFMSGMITENMMCAGNIGGKVDACQGDSGGPLMTTRIDKRLELAGIVSWGIGCGRVNYPGVYTRVTRYLNWIRQNTHDACYCRH